MKNQNVRDKIHRRSSARIQLEREALYSPAMRDLNTANAVLVYIDFLSRRRFEKTKSSRKSKAKWKFVNNGEIVYTYAEAEELGMSNSAFKRAIDSLIDHGFLDIQETGMGIFKYTTRYWISERWKQWGTEAFVERSRPKRNRWRPGIGFQPGHAYHPPKRKK